MVAPDDCPSQADYIKYFDDAIAVMQTEAALERIAYELCLDSAAENIDYLEVRWAPRLHLRQRLTIEQVIEAVLSGIRSGPIEAVAIVCAMRHDTPEDNVALAREAGRFAGRGLAAIRTSLERFASKGQIAADDVEASVAALTAAIGKASPQGLAASKALTTAPILAEFDRQAEELTKQSARLFVSDEAREGMLAFLQKRPPRWVS